MVGTVPFPWAIAAGWLTVKRKIEPETVLLYLATLVAGLPIVTIPLVMACVWPFIVKITEF